MKDKMVIKRAKVSDFNQFYELAKERDKGAGIKRNKMVWKKVFNEVFFSKTILLAFVNGVPAGFIYWSNFFCTKNPYVELIYVSKIFRRKNVARALFLRLEKIYKRKAKKIFSSAEDSNLVSIKMHKKLGFKRCGQITGIGKKSEKELFFSKKI